MTLVTQQHGSSVFLDARLSNPDQFPVSARSGSFNVRGTSDLVTSKLGALHFYQLAIPAPTPPKGSLDRSDAARSKEVFNGRGQYATCYVQPLFTEPGRNLHTPAEIGVDQEAGNLCVRLLASLLWRLQLMRGVKERPDDDASC